MDKKRRIRKDHKVCYAMLSPKLKVKGMLWVFHQGDDDYQPSVPHGHSKDGKYKLQLWTGNIYNTATGKLEYRAKKKDMVALKSYPGFLEFVKKCRDEYRTRNPAINLPELSCHIYKNKKRRRAYLQDEYVFFIRHNKI